MPTRSDDLLLPEGIVTGEAVLLDLRPASFATRALAFIVDQAILLLTLLGIYYAASELLIDLDDAGARALALVLSLGVMVGVPVLWESVTRGRSPGKFLFGMRVVRDDGGPIRWRQALIRTLLIFPEIYITSGTVALVASLANPRGKRLGDMLAGTHVVRERIPTRSAPPPTCPPELEGWARGADIGRLPSPLVDAARQFLSRAGRMNPAARARMGADLAGRINARVAPTPPGPIDPERFIAAVLSERYRRSMIQLEQASLRRQERRRRHEQAPPLSGVSTVLIQPQQQPEVSRPAPPVHSSGGNEPSAL